MRTARILFVSSALALWAGCGGNASSPSSTTPSAATPSAATPSALPTCDELLQRYRTTLAGRSGRCTTDADCVLTGSRDPETLCGVPTDLETARAVARIDDEMNAAGCGERGYSCPARQARCADGACYDPAMIDDDSR